MLKHHTDIFTNFIQIQLFIPNSSNLSESQKDTFLNQFITIFKKAVRDTDYLGRIGEDEFVILLPETPVQNVPALKERLVQKLNDYNEKSSKTHSIKVFFGFAGYQEKMKSVDALISAALKEIKRKGSKNA